MTKISFLSYKPSFIIKLISGDAKFSEFLVQSADQYINQLRIALSDPDPKLILIHPPEDERSDVEEYLFQQEIGSKTAVIFFGSRETQLDRFLFFISGEEKRHPLAPWKMVSVPEKFLEAHYQKIIDEYIKGEFDLRYALRQASFELNARANVSNDPTFHDIRNKTGSARLAEIFCDTCRDRSLEDAVNQIEPMIESLKALQDAPAPNKHSGSSVFPIGHFACPGAGALSGEFRIACIDDEHRNGWSTVLGTVLLGDTNGICSVRDEAGKLQVEHDGDTRLLETALTGLSGGLFALDPVDNDIDISTARKMLGIDSNPNTPALVPFDLVIVDYRLREEDKDLSLDPESVSGYQLVQKLREADPSVPIFVVTASTRTWTMTALKEVGIWNYYLKPKAHELGYSDLSEPENWDQIDYREFIRSAIAVKDTWWLRMLQWLHVSLDRSKNRQNNDISNRLRGWFIESLKDSLFILTAEPRLSLISKDNQHRERAFRVSLRDLSMILEDEDLRDLLRPFNDTSRRYPKEWKDGVNSVSLSKGILKCIRNAVSHGSLVFLADGDFTLLLTFCVAKIWSQLAAVEILAPPRLGCEWKRLPSVEDVYKSSRTRLEQWLSVEWHNTKVFDLPSDKEMESLTQASERIAVNFMHAREAEFAINLALLADLLEEENSQTWLNEELRRCAIRCFTPAMKALGEYARENSFSDLEGVTASTS